jgi:hypothetical protein
MTDTATESTDSTDEDATDPSDSSDPSDSVDPVDGAWLAAEVASLVSATVAFALWLDGSTEVAVPGGSVSALAATFGLLGLAAVAAAGKARVRGQDLRVLGHAVLAVGLLLLAAGGNVVLLAIGGLPVTLATLGVVVAVAGANLVVLDVVR